MSANLSDDERLRAYLTAAKRQQHASAAAGGGAGGMLSATSPVDDNDMRDLETLESLADMDGLITSVLNKDANLKDLLTQQDGELDAFMDDFVNAHCDEAENLCDLYHQVTECEGKLNDFESQIRDFLDRLTETADEVVQMQRSTDDLHIRVQNRKAVKSEITLVYEAIMECGKFCDDIVHRDVDASFLHEMKSYDAKLSKWNALLESNPNLVGSSVDVEISPRLASAAQRVGDKLQRHMQARFDALQDPGINIVLHQQIMEATGQYAFRFLASYNKPVAERLKSSYLSIIAEVHTKAIRNAMKDLLDAGTFAALPYEALLPEHVLKLMQGGNDVVAQKDFFMGLGKALGGQLAVTKADSGVLVAEAAACGLPPLATVRSCRFYLREDEYLSEFVSNNSDGKDLSKLPSPSLSIPRRATSVMPPASPASPAGSRRAGSVAGGGSGGSSGGGGGLSINSMKSMLSKLGGQSSLTKDLGTTTPFSNAPKDLRAATFENQVHALRAIHILEATIAAASSSSSSSQQAGGAAASGSNGAGADNGKGVSPSPLGVSPERRNGNLSVTPPAAGGGALAATPPVAAAPPAGDGSAAASNALVPPNYMGTVVLDPIVVGRLAKTDCWAIRFIVLLTSVVNAIIAERKFVRNFFLGHIRDTLRGDLEEEVILKSIFYHVLQQVETMLQTEVAALTDPVTMLVALRSVELLKNFVFQCPSPNPIMLLSTVFGSVSSALRDTLYKFLHSDERSLQGGLARIKLPALDKAKFPIISAAPTFNGEVDVAAMVQKDAAFASTLTVHPTVVAAAQLTAKLHALNVLHLKGSYVDTGSDASTFDDSVETTLRSIMGHCYTFINQLSGRFSEVQSRIPALVFVIVNLGHILYRWLAAARSARGLPSTMPLLVSHTASGRRANAMNAASGNSANDSSDSTALLLKAQLLFDDEDLQREAKNTNAQAPIAATTAGVAAATAHQREEYRNPSGRSVSPSRRAVSTSPSRARFMATQSLSQLDQSLTDSIHAFINADITARYPSLAEVIKVTDAIEATLGPNGLASSTTSSPQQPQEGDEGSAASATAAVSSGPCPVDADTFAKATAAFGTGWQEQLLRIKASLKALFTTTVMMMISGGTGGPANTLDADALLKAAESAVSATGAQPMAALLPHVNAAVLSRAAEANELLKRVLHDYYRVVVDANNKLVAAARRYYGDSSAVQSRLIGHHALEHELQQLLGGSR